MHPPLPPRAFAGLLESTYRFLRATSRWEVVDPAGLLARSPALFACHHGQLLPLLWAMEGHPLTVLVSRSGDGDLLAAILRRRGFAVVRGSTSRAGFQGARAALRALEQGSLGLAVDGPRGPRGEVQEGVVRISQRSGVPIVPLRAVGGSPWVAPGSWDRFELPRPLARVRVEVGDAIVVAPGDAGITAGGHALAQALGARWRPQPRPELASRRPSYGHP